MWQDSGGAHKVKFFFIHFASCDCTTIYCVSCVKKCLFWPHIDIENLKLMIVDVSSPLLNVSHCFLLLSDTYYLSLIGLFSCFPFLEVTLGRV